MSVKSLFIITGATKGIGLAMVNQLLEESGNNVIGIGRSKSTISNPNYKHIQLDLCRLDSFEMNELFPDTEAKRIVLVNNAGTVGEIGHLGEVSSDSIRKIFELNVIAPATLMNAFIKKYSSIKAIGKTIINISSGAAAKVIDGWSGYSASKSALNMLSQVAQAEANLKNNDIKIFALSPGVVDTDMQATIRDASILGFSSLAKFKDLKFEGKLSSPDFTADKIIYLINHASDFNEVIVDVRNF